jgi:hypothetical protein
VSNQSRPKLTIPFQAAAPIPACCFVGIGLTLPTAIGADTIGVTRMPALNVGDEIPVDVIGTAPIEAGAAINALQEVMTDTNGNAIPMVYGATPANKARGKALEPATAPGVVIEVLLYNN